MPSLALDTVSSPESMRRRPQIPDGIWIPLAIYGLARVFSASVMAWAGKFQSATSPSAGAPTETYQVYRSLPADPGYLGLVTNWDGQWYWRIAESGYIPSDVDGSAVAGWAWAFPPGYPKTVSALMNLTGANFPLVASLLSTVLGALAMVLLYHLVAPMASRINAIGAVLATSCFVTSPLFQVAYSESLSFVFIVTALLLLSREKMWIATIPILLLCFTRQVSPPLALVAVTVMFLRWRREGTSISLRSWFGVIATVLVSTFGVLLWPVISTAAGGGSGADRVQLTASSSPFGWFGYFADISWPALSIPVAIALAVVMTVTRKHREWGPALSAWALAYPLFVMTITPPTTGFLRYMLFAFPFGMLLTGSRHWSARKRFVFLSLGCLMLLALQILWIRFFYVYEVVDGQTPPMP